MKSLAETPFPEKININNYKGLWKLVNSFRAKLFLALMNKKPYGQDFFNRLERLPKVYYYNILELAVLMMSDINKEDKARIRAFAKKNSVIHLSSGMPLGRTYEMILQ
ncbi:MAG: hypothetical protein IEMM0008_1747 [bacterium]|nr:MAG: hypothetical protein IEMM0008_1747 [bacterium]